MNKSRRCFTAVHCELHSKCAIAAMPYTNGYFSPTNVGENCHHFQPLNIESDPHHGIAEMLANMAGAHE